MARSALGWDPWELRGTPWTTVGFYIRLWIFFPFCFTEEDVENFDVTNLSQDMLRSIEADSFWCMSKLLDGIQVSGPARFRALLAFCVVTALLCPAGPSPASAPLPLLLASLLASW